MLSIGVIHSLNYYLKLTGESLEPGEKPEVYEPMGYWEGVGAKRVGLVGEVESEDLAALVEEINSMSQAAYRPSKNLGLDLVFSADKSVSVLWALADERVRAEIEHAQAAAVRVALEYLQDTVGFTRRGHGGLRSEPGDLIFACFEHGSNRLGEPNLHTHALCVNLAVQADFSLRGVALRKIFREKMAAGAIYRLELAHQLQNRLDLTLERYREFFRVSGIPPSLCRAFSQRRVQIENAMAAKGLVSSAGAAAAALATRRKKRLAPRDDLYRHWGRLGQEYGFGAQQLQKLIETAEMSMAQSGRQLPVLHEILDEAVTLLMEQQSSFARRDLVRLIAGLALPTGLGVVSPMVKTLLTVMDKYLEDHPDIVNVGERHFSTHQMLALERDMLQAAHRLHGRRQHLVEKKFVVSAIELIRATLRRVRGRRIKLTPEQHVAVERLVCDSGDLALLAGVAGSGKTYLLSAANSVWKSAGFQVVGLAVEGGVAQALQEATGIESATIAKLFVDLEHSLAKTLKYCLRQAARLAVGKPIFWPQKRLQINSNTIVVLDEAGILDTRVLAAILEEVEKAGAKLVLVGDNRLPPGSGPNGGFCSLLKRLDSFQLHQPQRQRDPQAKRVVELLAEGRVGDALHSLAEQGLLKVTETRSQAMKQLIEDWSRVGAAKPSQYMIFASTPQEVGALNKLAQQRRRSLGKIGFLPLAIGKKPWFSPIVVGGKTFYIGDQIRLTKNAALYGVANGMTGTILSLDPLKNMIRIRLDGKRQHCVTLPLKNYTAFELGYCLLSPQSHGVTTQESFVLAGGFRQYQEQTYLQLSRAQGNTHLYLDEETGGTEAQVIRRQMEIARPVSLAIDSLERHSQQGDVPNDAILEQSYLSGRQPFSPVEERVTRVASIRPRTGRTRRVKVIQRLDTPNERQATPSPPTIPAPTTIPISL